MPKADEGFPSLLQSVEHPFRGTVLFMAHASPRMKHHARDMRKCSTRAEIRIWSWLRDRRFDGFKFKRQPPMGRYILDFYCAELNLAIELDGRHHDQPQMVEYDEARTRYLAKRGIYVLRIANELLAGDSRIVAEMIQGVIWQLSRRTPHPPSAPSPLCGGEKE